MEKKEHEEKDTTEKKEHKTIHDAKVKEHVIKEIKGDEIKRDSIRISKSTLWMITSGVLVILLIISISLFGFKKEINDDNDKDVESNQNSFIFMNSDGCTTLCDEMELVAKEIAQKAGLNFRKLKYSQPVPIPGYVLIKDGIITLNGISDKGSLFKNLCDATQNTEVCAEAKKADELALKSACENFAKEKIPQFKVFVMSFCPYGQKAIELVGPVVKDLDAVINFEPHYVVYDKSMYTGSEDSFCEEDVCSMHGTQELHEDMRQKCVWTYDKTNYWKYVNCINSNCSARDVDECWKKCSCVFKYVKKIDDCQKKEGVKLMRLEKDVMAKLGVKGSESLILNNKGLEMKDYRWDPNKLKGLICCGFEDKPEICNTAIKDVSASSGPAAGSCG